jgi:curved DNA-binding protein CbpA
VLTHPDKAPGGDRTALDKVSKAYDVLGSEEKRATYDRYEGVLASHDNAHHREDGGVSENGASSIGDGDDEYPTNTIVFYHLITRYRPAWRALDLISEGLPCRLSRGRSASRYRPSFRRPSRLTATATRSRSWSGRAGACPSPSILSGGTPHPFQGRGG